MSVKEKNDSKYELVVPDGGWGYMICLAAIINFITVTGFMPSFGLIYNDFMKEIGLESTGISLLNGINGICFALGGFVTNPLLKIMNLRMLTLVTVIEYILSNLLMLFVKSVLPFYLCVGVLQGLGMGVIFNLTYGMVNEYFVTKRLFAYSIIKTIVGVFVMFAPQLVKIALSEYGFKGTLLMISAVSLQSFIAVALMQPVSLHMKKVKKQPLIEETQVLLIGEKTAENELKLKFTEVTVESEPTEINKSDPESVVVKKSSWLVNTFNSLFDVSIMKLLLLTNASWCMAMSGVADLTFLTFIPQALYSYGWDKDNVALALSLIGLGDMVGRGCFIICGKWLHMVKNQPMLICGVMISVVARVCILCTSKVAVVLVFMALFGLGRCFLTIFFPMVIGELAGAQKFTAAIGFIMAMMGTVNIGCGPIFGAIRDYTQSYDITFWTLAAVLLVFSVSWSIELVYKNRKRAKNVNKS